MTLRLDTHWVWDFWHAHDGERHHLFYLQAPRALGDPEQRHRNTSIGHAVSDDLRDWTVLPVALAPAPSQAWDDATTWTGSVVRAGREWWMFYTGTSHAEGRLVQRVGAAVSRSGLCTWERVPGPRVEADARWYELLDLDAWWDQSWRDPWVFQLAPGGTWHMYVTARAAARGAEGGAVPADGRGVVGHAVSHDLITWEVQPPVTVPGDHGQLEVPQLLTDGGRWYLLFCTLASTHSTAWRERTGGEPQTGVYWLEADHPTGPFRAVDGAGPLAPGLYAGRVVETSAGAHLLGFVMEGPDGAFAGEIADPLPVGIDERGRLVCGAGVAPSRSLRVVGAAP